MTITAPAPQTTTVTRPASKTATKPIKAAVDRLREIREAIKVLDAEKDALTAQVLDFAGDAKSLTWGKTKLCTLVDSKNVRVDGTALRQAYPGIYADFEVVTPYKQVR